MAFEPILFPAEYDKWVALLKDDPKFNNPKHRIYAMAKALSEARVPLPKQS